MDTEKEVARLDKRIDDVTKEQAEQKQTLSKALKDILRFWHIAIGVALGLIIDKFGIEKIIGKLL